MITINLMPPHLRPIKRTALPHLISLIVLALALAAMAWHFMGMRAKISLEEAQLAQLEAKLATYDEVMRVHQEYKETERDFAKKVRIIRDILDNRMIWSKHLDSLAELTPKNIWYKQLRIIKRNYTVETPEFDKKGKPVLDKNKKPKMKKETRQRDVLEVSGYIDSAAKGQEGVSELIGNTTNPDTDFSRFFKAGMDPEIFNTEFGDVALKGFKLTYDIWPRGEK